MQEKAGKDRALWSSLAFLLARKNRLHDRVLRLNLPFASGSTAELWVHTGPTMTTWHVV